MANKLKTKKIASLKNLHEASAEEIKSFLNTASKELGSIDKLGSFIDDVEIMRETGVKGNLKFLVVEREEYEQTRPGKELEKADGTKNIFEASYSLPDQFPEQPIEEDYVLLSTVETHSCNPAQKCSSCSGSGKCSLCDARGYKRCTSCSGSGKDKQRDGSFANGKPKYKPIKCYSCHGSGTKPCNSCNGTAKCSICNGDGKVTCKTCGGTSYYQSYVGFKNIWKTKPSPFHATEIEEINDVLLQAEGKIGFEDELVEWMNQQTLLFDNRGNARVVNHQAPKVVDNIEVLAKLKENERVGRVHALIESIPITIVKYKFEGQGYELKIVGYNNIVCFQVIPKKHHYKAGIVTRFFNFFNESKRQIAFLYLASYMFNADDEVDASEIELLETFLNNIKLKPEQRNKIVIHLNKKLTLEEISKSIKILKGDNRALVFAWQCVMQDSQIKDSETQAFNQLVKFFKVKDDEVVKIKETASKFSKLSETGMIEEYFK